MKINLFSTQISSYTTKGTEHSELQQNAQEALFSEDINYDFKEEINSLKELTMSPRIASVAQLLHNIHSTYFEEHLDSCQ